MRSFGTAADTSSIDRKSVLLVNNDGPIGVKRDRVAVVFERHGLAALAVRLGDDLQNIRFDRVVQWWEIGRVYAFAFGDSVNDRRCGGLRVFGRCGRSSRNFRVLEFPRTLGISSLDRLAAANVDAVRIHLGYQLPQRLSKGLFGRDGRADVRTVPVIFVHTHSNDPMTIAIVSADNR